MPETKWTPGEWGYEDTDNPEMLTAGRDEEGSYIYVADVSLCCGDRWNSEQEEANKALIGASKLLYRELRRLVRLLEPLERDGSLDVPGLATLNGARRALAAARGEQNDA